MVAALRVAWLSASLALLALTFAPRALLAQGNVNDCEGHRWDVQGDGAINDGDNDTFDGGMHLIYNGQRFPGTPGQHAREGREMVFGPAQQGNLRVFRKLYFPPKLACVRYLEIFENTGDAPLEVRVQIYSNLGNSASQTLAPDPKDGAVCYAAFAQDNNRAVFGQRWASDKSRYQVTLQVQGDNIHANYARPLLLKPRGKAALLHVGIQRQAAALEGAAEFLRKLRLESFLKDVAPEDRRLIVNVRGDAGLVSLGGVELFRGERGDALKLQSGELLSGGLQTKALCLVSEFGERNLTATEVLSYFQLADGLCRVVLESGEVLSGRMKEPGLAFKLRGGSELTIPFSQVGKYGKRLPEMPEKLDKGDGDGDPPPDRDTSEKFTFTEPVWALRNGDRLLGKLAAEKLAVRTLYGELSVAPAALKQIQFPHGELRVPLIELTDGTSFGGLLAEPRLPVKLRSGATVQLETGRLGAVYFAPPDEWAGGEAAAKPETGEDGAPAASGMLRLVSGDLFHALLAGGELTLETAFGPQKVAGEQVLRLRPKAGLPQGVRLTLWDGTLLPGRLSVPALTFQTTAGAALNIPLEQVVSYSRACAAAPAAETAAAEALIAKLGDADPLLRDKSQRELLKLGPGTRAVLARHWKAEDLEVRTRVRIIYAKLQEEAAADRQGGEEDDEDGEAAPPRPRPSGPQPQGIPLWPRVLRRG